MRPPDDAVHELALEWLAKADVDLRAGSLLFASGQLYEPVTFHAQQAVEKALKAFLVWHQVEFPKTHDMSLLLELCGSVDAGLAESLADAEELTPYGVDYRYPGEQAPVAREAAEASLSVARAAVFEVERRLSDEPGG